MKPDREARLDMELEFHIEQHVRALMRSGASEAEARRQARIEFGGVEQVKEECRDARPAAWKDEMARDLRYALFSFRRSKAFALVAIATLGLAIGVNTASFGLLHRAVLAPLPVADPGRLRLLAAVSSDRETLTFSRAFHRAVVGESSLFEGVLFKGGQERVTVGLPEGGEAAVGELVSGNFFEVLGVRPHIGRLLTADDDLADGNHPVAVLSHRYWLSRFGGDPAVVGRTVRLTGLPFTILGVSAPGFEGLDSGAAVDLRVPASMRAQLRGLAPSSGAPNDAPEFNLVARLKAGVTERTAAELLTAVRQRLQATNPSPESARSSASAERIVLRSAGQGFGRTRDQFATPLWAVFGMTAAILVIACLNLANLLLARSSARRQEFAVRLSLGAGAARLGRQLLTECCLLGAFGGVLGLAAAWAFGQVLARALSAGAPVSALAPQLSLTVLCFHVAVTLLCVLVLGLILARGVHGVDLLARLKGAPGAESGRFTGRIASVAAQVALSMIILVGAGLFVRTLQSLRSSALGFRADHLVVVALSPRNAGLSDEEARTFFREAQSRARAIPGVSEASLSMVRLMSGSAWNASFVADDDSQGPPRRAARNAIGPGYFRTLDIPLVSGRDFVSGDDREAPKVAIVNESFARTYFGGRDPLGRKIGVAAPDTTIVGVVRDTRYDRIRHEPPAMWFVPYDQHAGAKYLDLNVRTTVPPESLVGGIREALASVDPRVALFNLRTQDAQIDEGLVTERMLASLATFFGGVAASLAALGLYGVLSLLVVSKRREIGIRIAIGALPAVAARDITRATLRWIAAGILLGSIVATGLATSVRSLLFGIEPLDPVSVVVGALIMAALAALGVALPARRAASIDPLIVIRDPN
jgi:predicted permease